MTDDATKGTVCDRCGLPGAVSFGYDIIHAGGVRECVRLWRSRAEAAEAERDEARRLAKMVRDDFEATHHYPRNPNHVFPWEAPLGGEG
jgi:hypothetical protein